MLVSNVPRQGKYPHRQGYWLSARKTPFIGKVLMVTSQKLVLPIDSGIGLSITIDKLRVFINKTFSTESLINQLLLKRVGLSIGIDSR